MSGNCIYVDTWDCGPDVYRAEMRKARKDHRCSECGDTIQRGDLHEYVSGLWEGYWDQFRTCARCLLVRADYFDGVMHGGMVEYFREEFGFDYRGGIPEDFAPCGENAEKVS